jgi:hypothetical protein
MFIAFLPLADARDLLDEVYENEAQAGEIEAELGSSFFYGGMASWDASALARAHMEQRREDFDQSEDAPLYYARLEAARFMTEAITPDMRVHSEEELADPRFFLPVNPVIVPEFYSDPADLAMPADPFSTFAPSDDDIPF